MSWLVLTKC